MCDELHLGRSIGGESSDTKPTLLIEESVIQPILVCHLLLGENTDL